MMWRFFQNFQKVEMSHIKLILLLVRQCSCVVQKQLKTCQRVKLMQLVKYIFDTMDKSSIKLKALYKARTLQIMFLSRYQILYQEI